MDFSFEFPAADQKPQPIPYMPTQDALVPRFKHNETTSLLRLLAELRLAIWEHTLGGNWIIPKFNLDTDPTSSSTVETKVEPSRFLNLLSTSRQIYHETHLLPFSANVWDFWDRPGPDRSWCRGCWVLNVQLTAEQRDAIGYIYFGFKEGEISRPRLSSLILDVIGLLKGLKVVVRESPMHRLDVEGIEEFSKKMGIKVVEGNLEGWKQVQWRAGRR